VSSRWTQISLDDNFFGSLVSNQIPIIEFVSYNLRLFTLRESKDITKERIITLLNIVKDLEPTVISFQEITRDIMQIVLEQEWVRKSYWISDTDQSFFPNGFGDVILSQLRAKSLMVQPLPSQFSRKVLISQFEINTQKVAVATTHLESYLHGSQTRKQQMQVIFHTLSSKNFGHAILMGSLNFATDRERRECLAESPEFNDIWLELHPEEDGFTFDPLKNTMINREQLQDLVNYPARLDMILLRTTREGNEFWLPEDIRIIGNEVIENFERKVFPSDHFGLLGSFIWVSYPSQRALLNPR